MAAHAVGRFFRPRPLTIQKRLAGLKGLALPELHHQLHLLHSGCCQHFLPTPLPNLVSDDTIDRIIAEVFAAAGTYTNSPELTAAIFERLWAGVLLGYGTPEVDYDAADRELTAALRTNVSQFADAKNYTMLRELNAALLNPDGSLRTFDQFKVEASRIANLQLKNYLQVEYDLAMNGAQMAAKWKQIQANRATLPMLRFEAVLDLRTTDICKPLDGVTLPIDHPFWRRFYPPNHYNCRSTVSQHPAGTAATQDDRIPAAEIPALFQTNLGEGRLVFPPNHPYFIR